MLAMRSWTNLEVIEARVLGLEGAGKVRLIENTEAAVLISRAVCLMVTLPIVAGTPMAERVRRKVLAVGSGWNVALVMFLIPSQVDMEHCGIANVF